MPRPLSEFDNSNTCGADRRSRQPSKSTSKRGAKKPRNTPKQRGSRSLTNKAKKYKVNVQQMRSRKPADEVVQQRSHEGASQSRPFYKRKLRGLTKKTVFQRRIGLPLATKKIRTRKSFRGPHGHSAMKYVLRMHCASYSAFDTGSKYFCGSS